MIEKPFHETNEYRPLNQAAQNLMRVRPAILANDQDGVIIYLGNFRTVLNNHAAINLANMIADSIDQQE